MQEVAYPDAAHASIVSVNRPLYSGGPLKFGSEAQKHEFLTPVASAAKSSAWSSPGKKPACVSGAGYGDR